MELKDIVNSKEYAEYFSISKANVSRHAKENGVRRIGVGRATRYFLGEFIRTPKDNRLLKLEEKKSELELLKTDKEIAKLKLDIKKMGEQKDIDLSDEIEALRSIDEFIVNAQPKQIIAKLEEISKKINKIIKGLENKSNFDSLYIEK